MMPHTLGAVEPKWRSDANETTGRLWLVEPHLQHPVDGQILCTQRDINSSLVKEIMFRHLIHGWMFHGTIKPKAPLWRHDYH
jgi:hypothetical protein